jgi:hypothetical protein
LGGAVNPTLMAAHKAVLAAQASLDAVQQCLVALLQVEEERASQGGCRHPIEARLTIQTMGGDQVMCNECGINLGNA